MIGRRPLWALFGFAIVLHALGMVRNPLPSQDGLKFIRIAREFSTQPWLDVVRDADQHPLYPALIAAAHPIARAVVGPGPDGWRTAAQGVSLVATLLMIVPLRAFARRMVEPMTADFAVLLLLVLPIPAALGHETLSDALALCAFAGCLAIGLRAFDRGTIATAIAAGIVGGIGYLARPEVAIVPATLAVAALAARTIPRRSTMLRLGAMLLPFSAIVAGYAAVNGTLSDKLLVKIEATAAPSAIGVGEARLDLPPKEESGAKGHLGAVEAVSETLGAIVEATSILLIPLALIGFASGRVRDRGGLAARFVWLYAIGFAAILALHAMRMGYLSSRHCVTIALVLAPWASAGVGAIGVGVADRWGMGLPRRTRISRYVVAAIVLVGLGVQARPGHPSRWGHRAAGQWLVQHAENGDAVFDTRGWAAFESGLRGYDPWHFRQAISDARLAFIVVGDDELRAPSRRAAILNDVLESWAMPLAAFPSRRGGDNVGVRVYRFTRPSEWEDHPR